MKKTILCTFLFIMICFLVGVSSVYYNYKMTLNEELAASKEQNKKPIVKGKYKIITTYEEFNTNKNRDENVFIVLGQTGCHFCELFQPILKSASEDYDIEILYVDLKAMSKEDSNSVMNSGLKIPAECTDSHQEKDISEGFKTPLSLFVRKGETYDCLRGFVQKDLFASKLKDKGYIEKHE